MKQSYHSVRGSFFQMNKLTIHLDGSFFFFTALLLLMLPLPWILALSLAGAVHECFHAAAIAAFQGEIYSLRLHAGGIQMETNAFTPGKELICALAGPLGSALLLLFVHWLPRTAVCGAIHCAFNLLPLFPMDGGRALRSLVLLALPGSRGEKCFQWAQRLFCFCLFALCIVGCFRWGGVFFPAMVIVLWRVYQKRTV